MRGGTRDTLQTVSCCGIAKRKRMLFGVRANYRINSFREDLLYPYSASQFTVGT